MSNHSARHLERGGSCWVFRFLPIRTHTVTSAPSTSEIALRLDGVGEVLGRLLAEDEGADLAGRLRRAEEVALRQAAAVEPELGQLIGRLDPSGHDREAEGGREADDRRHR